MSRRVVDGIVTFEELSDAERFAGLLEADGADEVCGLTQQGLQASMLLWAVSLVLAVQA